jgi:hypothetical protein
MTVRCYSKQATYFLPGAASGLDAGDRTASTPACAPAGSPSVVRALTGGVSAAVRLTFGQHPIRSLEMQAVYLSAPSRRHERNVMSEFDSKALERVLDEVLPVRATPGKTIQQQGVKQQLVQLQTDKHIGPGEADGLGGVVAMVHAEPRPEPKAVIAKIDQLVDQHTISSPVALTLAAVLRRLAEIAAAQPDSGSSVKAGLISQEQQEPDWAAASDACVEGGVGGGLIGMGLGAPEGGIGAGPGAVFGAAIGCIAAAGVVLFGHQAGGGKK